MIEDIEISSVGEYDTTLSGYISHLGVIKLTAGENNECIPVALSKADAIKLADWLRQAVEE